MRVTDITAAGQILQVCIEVIDVLGEFWSPARVTPIVMDSIEIGAARK